MKRVWQTEINLLEEFDGVCKKHGLKYMMLDGSLLGAVRHKGFIPWDDDIDVVMLREEYEKLLKVADEFKEPFFLQNPLNDKIYRGHSQLRDSRTAAIMYKEFCREANQGIFIDVFVADRLPKSKFKMMIQRRRCNSCKALLRFYRVYNCQKKHSAKSKVIKFLLDIFYGIVGYERFFKHYERLCGKYNKEKDAEFCNILEYRYDDRKIRMEHLTDLTLYDFHYLKVPGPKDADGFLTDFFGDWHKFVIGGGEHGETYFDPDKSYKEYIKMSISEIRKMEEK